MCDRPRLDSRRSQRTAARLEAAQLSTQLVDAREVTDTSSYEAVVLGSAIHNSGWMRPAAAALGRAFAGVLLREHYSNFAHLVFRAIGGRYGDHRPWGEIDAWADEIGREVARRSDAV